MPNREIVIDSAFEGLPGSSHGGYACGVLASYLAADAEITLRKPVPLGAGLRLAPYNGGQALHDENDLVAGGASTRLEDRMPHPPTFTEALAATASFPALRSHPYPRCVGCGTGRTAGVALRIFPGPLIGHELVAAVWYPSSDAIRDGFIKPEFAWAALDCPGGWAAVRFGRVGRPAVLGRMAARLLPPITAQQAHIVVGWLEGVSGRKLAAGSALYTRDGAAGLLPPNLDHPHRGGDDPMRRGIALTPMEIRRDVIVGTATLADELGYEIFSIAEGWALDSTVLLAELAAATRRITLAAGVLSVWGRTPATIAMAAATLHQLSGGRFVLGLGASTPQLVEGWHDINYDRPATRLRDVTTRIRALLNGDRAALSAVPQARALRLGQPPVPDLPIWLAATGERTIRIAADLADGWYPIYLLRDRIRELAASIAQHRAATRPITVAAGPFTVVDPDPTAARAAAAACTTTYLAAMGDIYPRLVAAQGLATEVDLVRSTKTIPSQAQILLDEFTAYGTTTTVQQQLAQWDATVDITLVGLPPGLPWPRIEATVRAAAPQRSTSQAAHRSNAVDTGSGGSRPRSPTETARSGRSPPQVMAGGH